MFGRCDGYKKDFFVEVKLSYKSEVDDLIFIYIYFEMIFLQKAKKNVAVDQKFQNVGFCPFFRFAPAYLGNESNFFKAIWLVWVSLPTDWFLQFDEPVGLASSNDPEN